MKITILHKADVVASEWDGGKTYEYFIYPPESNYSERNFLFRISSASIDKVPSQFTRFENYQRYLVMLDNSLELVRNGNTERYEKHELFTFDSNDAIVSSSLGTDFNIMVAKAVEETVSVKTEGSYQFNNDFLGMFALEDQEVLINNIKIKLKALDVLLLEYLNKSEVNVGMFKSLIIFGINFK